MGKFDEIFDDVVVNAKAAASAVSKKASSMYDTSKHKITAAELRGEINKKLKELGITDLSPEAVLAMVQSHLDTQSNLRKDNCQKQKEIDAKKAEIASQQDELIKAREERDTAQKNEQNLISIMGNCLGVLSKVEVKYNELLAQDSIPNIKTSDNEELNAYFLKLANLFVKMSSQQSTYVRGTKVNGGSEKTQSSLPPGEAEEDFDSGYDENAEPKVAVDEGESRFVLHAPPIR